MGGGAIRVGRLLPLGPLARRGGLVRICPDVDARRPVGGRRRQGRRGGCGGRGGLGRRLALGGREGRGRVRPGEVAEATSAWWGAIRRNQRAPAELIGAPLATPLGAARPVRVFA